MSTTIIVTYSSETAGENVVESNFQRDKTIEKKKKKQKVTKRLTRMTDDAHIFQSDKTMKKKEKKKMMT